MGSTIECRGQLLIAIDSTIDVDSGVILEMV